MAQPVGSRGKPLRDEDAARPTQHPGPGPPRVHRPPVLEEPGLERWTAAVIDGQRERLRPPRLSGPTGGSRILGIPPETAGLPARTARGRRVDLPSHRLDDGALRQD